MKCLQYPHRDREDPRFFEPERSGEPDEETGDGGLENKTKSIQLQ